MKATVRVAGGIVSGALAYVGLVTLGVHMAIAMPLSFAVNSLVMAGIRHLQED